MTRIQRIEKALQALNPIKLNIIDNSADHIGHSGAEGGGHFAITIVSEAFTGKTAVAQHQLVYAALGDLLKTDIHAVQIEASPPQ